MTTHDDREHAEPPLMSAPPADEGGRKRGSALGFLIGWVLLPLLAASALVLSGMHQAAHNPDAWYTRAVRAFSDLH